MTFSAHEPNVAEEGFQPRPQDSDPTLSLLSASLRQSVLILVPVCLLPFFSHMLSASQHTDLVGGHAEIAGALVVGFGGFITPSSHPRWGICYTGTWEDVQ